MNNQTPHDLTLEHLRKIRSDIRKLTTAHQNLTVEVRLSNSHVATLVQGEVLSAHRFAEVEARLDRIERRLQITDPAIEHE